jgi:quercetin dioxygenase-like cupin family protein
MTRLIAVATLFVFSFVVAPGAQQPTGTTGHPSPGHLIVEPAAIEWEPAPDALPPGAKLSMIEGDMSKNEIFTARIKLPDGYTIPPHWHPAQERITILSGTLLMGMGEQLEEAAMKPLAAGSYASMEPGTRHYVKARGETEVQLTTIGPWAINYVNPSDDPRSNR